MVTKSDAIKAWETLDSIIDNLDYIGVFIDNELNDVEKSMTILYEFLKQEGK